MTTRTKSNGSVVPGLQRIQRESERLYQRLRKDAGTLLARGRKQIAHDVRGLQRRADRATRDFEASLLKRVHAVSEAQLKRLERRLAAMEKRVVELERGSASV